MPECVHHELTADTLVNLSRRCSDALPGPFALKELQSHCPEGPGNPVSPFSPTTYSTVHHTQIYIPLLSHKASCKSKKKKRKTHAGMNVLCSKAGPDAQAFLQNVLLKREAMAITSLRNLFVQILPDNTGVLQDIV